MWSKLYNVTPALQSITDCETNRTTETETARKSYKKFI